jgi:hypothetical protein
MTKEQVTHRVRYCLTWKSDNQHTPKVAYFVSHTTAEEWYNEKLTEGKKPVLTMKQTTTITHKLK